MNNIISYNTVKKLVENPPSIGDRPNCFNLRALRNHFARKLKNLECPQSRINGWLGFVLSPPMYSLIDPNPWRMDVLNMASIVPEFPPRFEPDGITPKAYSREETMNITTRHTIQQNYHLTAQNIYRGVYDALDAHVDDAFKVAPKTTPPTITRMELLHDAQRHLRSNDDDVRMTHARCRTPEHDDISGAIQSPRSA